MCLLPKKNYRYLFLCLILINSAAILSCGTEDSSSGSTGSYVAKLKFPGIGDAEKIDCDAADIHAIICELFSGDATQIKKANWLCSQGGGTLTDIPLGSGYIVVVKAEDSGGNLLLTGEKRNIAIEAGRRTEGRIEMIYVDSDNLPATGTDEDNDGYFTPADCDDTNPDVNPAAEEVPGNEIDENCDDIAEPSSDSPQIAFTIEDLGMAFARIPAGTFMMGSPEEESGRREDETLHEVTLTQDYYMQTTEVTQGQWYAVMGNDSSGFHISQSHPVDSVTWDAIQIFIANMAEDYPDYECRLPTEAEWEYAARAERQTAFWNGPLTSEAENFCYFDENLNRIGWYCRNSSSRTHPVGIEGGMEHNKYGLYDMHGNVMEWCSDWYAEYPTRPEENPQGPTSRQTFRVLRGGSWQSFAKDCRSAARYYKLPDVVRDEYELKSGFRLVCFPVSR